LCVWLRVPGKETCGSQEDLWGWQRVNDLIQKEIQNKSTLVLPLATLIETGNHISQAGSHRYERAQALSEIIVKAADQKTPWAAFTDQTVLWSPENIRQLAEDWPALAAQKLSIGDVTIKQVAEYYAAIMDMTSRF